MKEIKKERAEELRSIKGKFELFGINEEGYILIL